MGPERIAAEFDDASNRSRNISANPTPKSEAAYGLVRPLIVAMRTASPQNSSAYHCRSKETGTKPWRDQFTLVFCSEKKDVSNNQRPV